MNNDMLFLAVYLLLGIPLSGLYAYMYDRLKGTQPDGESKDGLLSAYRFLAGIWILPFRYLKFGRKEKDGKAPVVFLAFWVLLVAAILLGHLAAGSGTQAPTPFPAPTMREGATGSRTSQEGDRLPRHAFAFFASTPLCSLRFHLALPLRVPCAWGGGKFFPIVGKRAKIFSNHWKNRAGFSNHWKKVFQSLENLAEVFQPLEKSFQSLENSAGGRLGAG